MKDIVAIAVKNEDERKLLMDFLDKNKIGLNDERITKTEKDRWNDNKFLIEERNLLYSVIDILKLTMIGIFCANEIEELDKINTLHSYLEISDQYDEPEFSFLIDFSEGKPHSMKEGALEKTEIFELYNDFTLDYLYDNALVTRLEKNEYDAFEENVIKLF